MDMEDKIAAAFAVFHEENPWVYDKLRDLALALRRSGVKHYGISGLFETLRYEVSLRTRDADGFKLNNNFAALYARKLAQAEPNLETFFKFRVRRPRYTQALVPEVDAWDRRL